MSVGSAASAHAQRTSGGRAGQVCGCRYSPGSARLGSNCSVRRQQAWGDPDRPEPLCTGSLCSNPAAGRRIRAAPTQTFRRVCDYFIRAAEAPPRTQVGGINSSCKIRICARFFRTGRGMALRGQPGIWARNWTNWTPSCSSLLPASRPSSCAQLHHVPARQQ